MALNLRKSVVHSILFNTALIAGIGLVYALATGSLSPQRLGVVCLLALVLGPLSGWLKMRTMAQKIIGSIPAATAYARISRDHDFGEVNIEWHHLDDYAAQLLAGGFTHLGDFTGHPMTRALTGAVAIYLSRDSTTLVEIQYIRLSQTSEQVSGKKANGVHFSLFSLVGGQIRITTTDHTPIGINYILRSPCDVLAAFPGENLMSLLDKHRRLRATVCERTGKSVSGGLSMTHFMLLNRQRYDMVRERLAHMSSYQLISEIDRFEANPLLNWAQPSAVLAKLPLQSMQELEQTGNLHPEPLIVDVTGDHTPPEAMSATSEALQALEADADAEAAPDNPASDRELATSLLTRLVGRSAAWFYWIAGLSLVNLLTAIFDSSWNFSLGLGFSQLLYQQGKVLQGLNAPTGGILVMYLGCIGSIAFIAACGYFARKPSVFVFTVGMVCMALDSLIFLLASNFLAVLIHAVALYFLYRGMRGARLLRLLQETQPAPA